ncbi:UDP-N-acetylglucosamine transporter-like protein [Dinothrombium tinctorium]|uniref:UDP-N-acetylglucosamine transporter-like protein n=1 Tax=Dinothrombium tinctorium TaxID=1965070 RepID=A0A443RPA7_9ACAR|nr:UDP-N-acetylglucosamine transporter-like protein [Dinothrombium tinctorium]
MEIVESDIKMSVERKAALKYIALSVLVVQTTSMVLVLRYSRTVAVESNRYLGSTVITLSELLKIIISFTVVFKKSGIEIAFNYFLREINDEIVKQPLETCKLLIPAALYTIQNNLLFLALSNLDAATYQVTYQLKILVTALFSVFMLKKRLVVTQWIALLFLMIGVTLVQWPNEEEAEQEPKDNNRIIGLFAVITCCILSGFSGVYFEKLIKSTPQSLWIRNIQLSFFGFLLGAAAVLFQDFTLVRMHGFFQGYNFITWVVIWLHAAGGIVVALVMKYADNILKGFATSVSIVLSTIFSYCLLQDFTPSLTYFLGASIVIFSTILYSV